VGGIPEVVDDGRTGFLVPAGAAATLAERIVTLLDDEPLRLAVGRAAQARVRSEFSFASMAQRYLDVFRGVTGTQDQVAKACSL
jgi:glycosyltransferase involved in cell wall biosynthesis